MSVDAMEEIATAIQAAVGGRVDKRPESEVHGGSISRSYRWGSASGPLFVKLADSASAKVFAAEAAGLQELAAAGAVRVPEVLAHGSAGGHGYLALEWIELGNAEGTAQSLLGEQLAFVHRVSSPTFGWHRDNTIGSTPQFNEPSEDWVAFFRERRLRYQLDLARAKGHGSLQARGHQLLDLMGAFFSSYRPVPSLLHGDLWSGNFAADAAGAPVVFDPAVYFGDRETDIAMTRLFGGFGAAFYTAYQSAWPLDQAAGTRRGLYNLYHLLNHLNLFGGGYGAQAQSSIDRLLAELGH